jgi:hypothetical protein
MTTLPPNVISNIAQRRLQAGQQKQTSLQDYGNSYNTNIANLDQYSKDMTQRINDQMGAQGLFNSGIRMNELGKMQQSVGQKHGYFDQLYAQQKSGVESQYQNALAGINDYETQMYQQQTQQDLAYQQQVAQQAFQQQQLKQQQDQWAQEQWNAAMARNQQQQAPPPPQQQGPSQEDLMRFFAEVQRQQAIQQWLAAIAAQNPTKDEYAGSGNALGYAGARFK